MAEAWEWARIQFEPCPFCEMDPASEPKELLAPEIRREASAWHAFLTMTSSDVLRRRAVPGMFTPLENGAHTRDMLRVFGERIVQAIDEDEPELSWFDPGPAESGYNDLDPLELAAEIETEAVGLAEILANMRPSDWERRGTRSADPRVSGSPGDTFTVRGMACYVLHEAHHHLENARRGSDISR